MQKMGKNILSVILTLAMLFTMLPVSIFADGASTNIVGMEAAGTDPGFSAYGPYSRDWDTNTPYYYLKSNLSTYLIGTKDTFQQGLTGSQWNETDKNGNNKWGSLAAGTMMDAVPNVNQRENLDWTYFVLCKNPNGIFYYPNGQKNDIGMLRTSEFTVDNVNSTVAASVYWDGNNINNQNITGSVKYSLEENTPLLKMEITLKNNGDTAYTTNFLYIIDCEESGEQYTYIPGIGWKTGGGNQLSTSGWTGNYIFSGKKGAYTGNPAHAIIWPEDQLPSAMVSAGDYTGPWFPVSLDANGGTQVITLYHMAHIPGPEDKPYATAELWADAVKNNTIDNIAAIQGIIQDKSAASVAGAEVTLTYGTNTYTGISDASGRYQVYVPVLAEGSYTFKVEKTDSDAYTDTVIVSTNIPITKNIELEFDYANLLQMAKENIEAATYTATASKTKTEQEVLIELERYISELELNEVDYTVNKVSYTAPVNGTAEDNDGTAGSYVFTVDLTLGTGEAQATGSTAELSMTVPACSYTAILSGLGAGLAASTVDPGILSYSNEGATKDWIVGDYYYYIENNFTKYTIGTTSHPQVSTWSVTGIDLAGSLVEGTMVDAFSKANRRENLDYSEIVLLPSTKTDLRNWYYYQYKLRMPEISSDFENGTITAEGDWDYDSGIKSSVVYSMTEDSPLLRMDITLTNMTNTAFSGNIGYIIDANEGTSSAADRATYIPGVGWKTTDASSGTQLTSGWTEGYVYIGQKDTYTGYTGHAVIWDEATQPAVAVIPKYTYTGAWFNVELAAGGGTKTITIYHFAEVPPTGDEPYAAASLWADAVKNGTTNAYTAVGGTVTDSNGNKIAGATINATDGTNTYTAETNSNGNYYLWTAKGSDCWITASYAGMADLEKQLVQGNTATTVDFVLSPTVVGEMPAGKNPGFSGYAGYSRDWDTNTPYYYLKNNLATYLIGTMDKMQDGVTGSQWSSQYYDITGQNKWGSLTKGSIMDAVPAFTGYENLDWTEFIIASSVNGRWFYPNGTLNQGMLRLGTIATDESAKTVTASGYWDGNASNGENLQASITYSMVENSPLLKMDITITNQNTESYSGYFGYYFDKEGSGEEYVYIPGAGWYPYSATNVHITSGWNGNYLFSGRQSGYTGYTAHSVIWPDDQQPYGMINNGGHTGVDYALNLAAGESTVITLYHMAHVPGAESEPYASAALWADAVKDNALDAVSTINGMVTDSASGNPIEGAIIGYTDDTKTYTAVSNQSGEYQLFVPKNGEYSITADKTGYSMDPFDRTVSIYFESHLLSMQSSTNSFEVELPDSQTAQAGTTLGEPVVIYATEACNDWVSGDLILLGDEATALIDKTSGALKDASPKNTGIDSIGASELVLANVSDVNFGHTGCNFDMSSVVADENKVIATGISQINSAIAATVKYSLVDNSPLIKVKVSLKNNGASIYTGSFGYLYETDGNGEQTYIPGSGWIGGGPGGYAKDLKTPGQSENYLFNGTLGEDNENSAQSIIWSDYFRPSKLTWSGDWSGVWFDVSIDADGRRDIIFYHYAQVPGEKNNPLSAVEFWTNVVKQGIDPSTVAKISGNVSKDGDASTDVGIVCVAGEETYYTETLSDGTYTIYGIAGTEYSLTASSGGETTNAQTATLEMGGSIINFDIASEDRTTEAGLTYGSPGYTYDPGRGLRDWWPIRPYYFLKNEFTKISVDTRRLSVLTPARPSEDSSVWSDSKSGNNVWGSLSKGTIVDAVSTQNMTENLDWSAFVLFPTRPGNPSDPDYFNRNYVGVTDEDEAIPNEMYMEWSWWFPVNKLDLGDISTDGETITASGVWEGGVDLRDDILASVKYSLVENSPLVKMDITLTNTGTEGFDGQFAYLLDPDKAGEQQSYLPGYGWEYSQVKRRIASGWTDNYIFDGCNGFTGSTAHAIIWPDDQQPMLVFNEAGWISAWFKTDIEAGGTDNLTIYYMPHTPGYTDAPYAIAEYWSHFIKNAGDSLNQASIKGTVTDKNGNALSNVEVKLFNDSGTHMKVVTDFNGNYTLFAEAGDYTLRAYNSGYTLLTKDFTLAGGDLVVEDIELIKFTETEISIPEGIERGDAFEFEIKVTNLYDSDIDEVYMEVIAPSSVKILSDPKTVINNLAIGEERTYTVKALAVYGGRETMRVKLSNSDFSVTNGKALDISGYGWYGGDNHSHSDNSDGSSTIAQNVASAYNNWNLSWLMNTDHNTNTQEAEAEAATTAMVGKFLSISGIEVTTGYRYKPTTPSGDPRGHALVYGYDGIPTLIINEEGGEFDWQDSIAQVTDAGALFYMAHPFDNGYPFETPYSWQSFTGVEVWNGSWHASNIRNQQAFEFWDKINIRGEKHYYGISGTDGHNDRKVGDTGVKGSLDALTTDNVLDLLATGQYYGTNGPDLRFSVNGVGMGNVLTIGEAGDVIIDLEAFSEDGNLTNVKVLAYPVTGNMEDYENGEVIFQKDLSLYNTNFYSESFITNVTQKMFFRVEVKSENCTPGSSGNGPDTGKGFAYSNPVWVEIGLENTSLNIEGIRYDGKPIIPQEDGFGRKILYAGTKTFDADMLNVVANGTAIKNFKPVTSMGSDVIGLLDIVVSASDSAKTVYTYLVCYKALSPTPTPTPTPVPVLNGQLEIEASEGDEGEYEVDIPEDALTEAINQAKEGGSKTIEVKVANTEDAVKVKTDIPAGIFKEAESAGIKRIELDMGIARISFSTDAFEKDMDSTSKSVDLSVELADKSLLPSDILQKVGDKKVYDFNAYIDGTQTSRFKGGNAIQITLDYDLAEGEDPHKIVVYYINDKGELEVVRNAKYNAEDGSVTFKTNHFSKYVSMYADITFGDLQDAAWARECIEALASREIVSGMGNGLFSPNEKVTREQFIKMLLLTFDLVDEDAECTFKDVHKDTWYYKYVASAQELGICNGVGSNEFGIGRNITRQDMIVLVRRALDVSDKDLPDGTTTDLGIYTDYGEISPYAEEAVKHLIKNGLIVGYNNKINPKGLSTRAEAAALIYRVCNIE